MSIRGSLLAIVTSFILISFCISTISQKKGTGSQALKYVRTQEQGAAQHPHMTLHDPSVPTETSAPHAVRSPVQEITPRAVGRWVVSLVCNLGYRVFAIDVHWACFWLFPNTLPRP